ncbi:MAG: FAD-dependent monooxygenase [Bacteroidota bacterium]|nr:FAD-dependent monooxygenase [Bacteroidota bacterium]
MTDRNDKPTEVLIVGAGPAGLMMACQLAIHRIPFRIIDKNESSSKNSGALIVQARSLEIFEQMGIASEALTQGIVAGKLNIIYNGKKITSTVINDIGGNLSRFPFLLMLEQSKTEKLLLKFIIDHGHIIERGIRFKSFSQENEKTTSVVVLPDGSEQSIISNYVIAADGANSSIRNFLNIPFEGKTYLKPIFILDVKAKTELLPGEISFTFSNSSVAGFFPLPGSRWRIDSDIPPELEKLDRITFVDIEKDFHRWTKMKITFQDYDWFSVAHSHQKYAKTIHVRNCFLIGDAAHINTPVGAQGMNTGLQDAFNLAWKLAFVIRHKAKPELLNTYSTERSGISRDFARYADTVFKLVTSTHVVVKFFRLYLLRFVFKFLFPLVENRKSVKQKFFKSISQTGIHYRKSILSDRTQVGNFLSGSPKPGDRFPYLEFYYMGKNTNTLEILDVTGFTLFVLANELTEEIKVLAGNYNLAVKLISHQSGTEKLYEQLGIKHIGYYLVRPDMHIALRSASLNTRHLNNYLQKFLS